MFLPVLKSRATAISELEGACSILDMDTKVLLKRPLRSTPRTEIFADDRAGGRGLKRQLAGPYPCRTF